MADQAREYDVFISYNSLDEADALQLKRLLEEQMGLKVWFDKENILPGESVHRAIERGLSSSLNCLILIGNSGRGPWQDEEIEIAIRDQIKNTHFKVIVIILPSVVSEPDIPKFLLGKLYVDLRKNYLDGIRNLLNSIRGKPSFTLYNTPSKPVNAYEDDDIVPAGYTTDVVKVVELLIGESLYSTKDVFIRELVQNAVDACERRKVVSRAYMPNIKITINTNEGWFDVEDNGEGMNPYLLKNSFAVIGKSIRQEGDIKKLLKEERLNLIAKFGIGFASTFMVSERIYISTKHENSHQINLEITAFDKRFTYLRKSECERDANLTGTTECVNDLRPPKLII